MVLAAGFFFIYAYSANQKGSADGYTLFANFERIDGLTAGSDVKMSGVKIGTVINLEINPQTYQAKVILSLKHDIQLPQDSSAEITSESLLGGKYISIIAGEVTNFSKKG